MIAVMRLFIDQAREIENAKKIDSLGIFAGGLAHDFNNILSGILGNVSLLMDSTSRDDHTYEWMTGIEYAAYRARALTTQLLTFAKGGAPIKETASIHEIVVETVNFTLSGSKIKPRFKVDRDLMNAVVDAGQISQVIQNLVINAVDATADESGFIDIRIENSLCRLPGRNSRNMSECIKIEIRDYGRGIPARDVPYVFDPYFTTKEKGSGLGLAVSYSIIRKHDGDITVQSRQGEGTIMTVYLPASQTAVKIPEARTAYPESFSGHILVMDDDPILRSTFERMLSHIGFRVTTVTDGKQAVDLVRSAHEKGEQFDAVIMDLTVSGGMGGQQAASIMAVEFSYVPLIVASGYSDDPVMADYRDYGFSARLVKPVSLDDLKIVMLEVLPDTGRRLC